MESTIHTLQEFMTLTKGSAYIISAIALGSFLLFWLFLTGREAKK